MTTRTNGGAPVVYLTRRETFCAGHRLWSAALSDADNRALFGPCAYDHGHGHNYVLEVTLRTRHALQVIEEMAKVEGAIVGSGQALLIVWLTGGLLAAGPSEVLAAQAQTSFGRKRESRTA